MNTRELQKSISLSVSGYGRYNIVYTTPTGRQKTGYTTDMGLIDRVKGADIYDKCKKENYGNTLKQALLSLKNCCKSDSFFK